MRAGSLSDSTVISLVNAHFVPVWVATNDYGKSGAAPADEKKRLYRVWREAREKKLPTDGTVACYVLDPETGDAIDSMSVPAQPKRLIPLLKKHIREMKVPAGPLLVKPFSQSGPPKWPKVEEDALALHLISRGVDRAGKVHRSSYGFPFENWIIYKRPEWKRLMPEGPLAVGTTWELDKDLIARVLAGFHSWGSCPDSDVERAEIEEQTLRATVVSLKGRSARVRLDGHLKMVRTGHRVEASLAGVLDLSPEGIDLLRLVTRRATDSDWGRFAVGVRSVPVKDAPWTAYQTE